MEKYLVNIEFRYQGPPKWEDGPTSKNKTVTIGIYETFEDACYHGNILLRTLESKFQRHKFPDGTMAKTEGFSKNGGPFGSKKTLVTNLAYIKTPFEFYARIETLKFDDINDSIEDVIDSVKEYTAYKLAHNNPA